MNFLSIKNFLVSLSLLAFSQASFSMAAWDNTNAPRNMVFNYQVNLAKLPLSADLEKMPWSDHYYPTYQGGISYRWNLKTSNDIEKIGYKLLDKNSLKNISSTKTLSPSEKYDLYLGRLDFPLTNHERKRTEILKTVPGSSIYDRNFEIPRWEGLCHAWAPATLLFQNPKPVTIVNSQGMKIEFGSSDIKSLLTYFLHTVDSDNYFLGSRCNLDFAKIHKDVEAGKMTEEEFEDRISTEECNDTNAGAFHVVIANQIALLKEGFVADVTRDAEVWNQPVYGYTTKIISQSNRVSRNAAPGTVKEVVVETEMRYIAEVSQTWDFTVKHSGLGVEVYNYTLELDRNGNIVGGEWLNEKRPDFLWKRTKPNFKGFFGPLQKIYEESIR